MAVYLSMGANLGDREKNLHDALRLLASTDDITMTKVSRVYETAPVGDVDQGDFLNIAVGIETSLSPPVLLDCLKHIESALGRKPTRRWGPRLIDIDIILWDDLVYHDARLTIPHPAYRERAFVLIPLTEIAPEAVDPAVNTKVADLAAECGDEGVVNLFAGDLGMLT